MRCSCHILGDTISIHAPRTGSDRTCSTPWSGSAIISIHAPRTGSDTIGMINYKKSIYFNPRSPHGERRTLAGYHLPHGTFQSTLPARGATHSFIYYLHIFQFQSTLPARGATSMFSVNYRSWRISIHAPRTGSDFSAPSIVLRRAYFNPRSPHGERPVPRCHFLPQIHFNPRSPHGERPGLFALPFMRQSFQSTLPARGATDSVTRSQLIFANFNPRSPHGERRHEGDDPRYVAKISIHAPRTGSDFSSHTRTHRII